MSNFIAKTGTKVTTKVGTKVSVVVIFLGVILFAAASLGLKLNKTQPARVTVVPPKVVEQVAPTPASVSYGHYVNYMKMAGQKSFPENGFWQKVAASNWFLNDSLSQIKKNPSRQSEYVIAMSDAVKKNSYTNLKNWYNFVYSSTGYNFNNTKLQKNVWLIMRESYVKQKYFAGRSILRIADQRKLGKPVVISEFKLNKNHLNKKPLSPAMFDLINKLVQPQTSENVGGAGSSSGGSMPSSSSGGSSVGCVEGNSSGEGSLGGLGGNAGGTNPASMGGGYDVDPINPEVSGNYGGGGTTNTAAGSKNQTGCLPFGQNPMPASGGGNISNEAEGSSVSNGTPLTNEELDIVLGFGKGEFDFDDTEMAPARTVGDTASDVVEAVQDFRSNALVNALENSLNKTVSSGMPSVGFGGTFSVNPNDTDDSSLTGGGCVSGGGGVGVGSGGGCSSSDGCGVVVGTLGNGFISGSIGGDIGGFDGGSKCDFVYSTMSSLGFYSDPSPIEYNVTVSMIGGTISGSGQLVGGKEMVTGVTKVKK